MDNISADVREIIMGSLNDNPDRNAPPVTGSFNVVGDNNTVVFPGISGDWSETQAAIVSALPKLSDDELARIQALIKQVFENGDHVE